MLKQSGTVGRRSRAVSVTGHMRCMVLVHEEKVVPRDIRPLQDMQRAFLSRMKVQCMKYLISS